MVFVRRVMSGVLASLALLMCSGATGCGDYKMLAKHPTKGELRVNIGIIDDEQQLPSEMGWSKINQAIAQSQGWRGWLLGVLIGGEPAKDVELRLQKMRDEAMKGQTGSSPVNAFNEMVPEIAQALVSKLPAENKTAKKQVLVLAPVDNRLPAGASETPGLQSALDELQYQLGQNEAVLNEFVLLSRLSDSGKKALETAMGGKEYEFIDPAARSGGPVKYAPNEIYLITPRIFQNQDLDKGQVTFRMGVDVQRGDAATLSAHLGHRTSRTYFYQPYAKTWWSPAQNQEAWTRFWAEYDRRNTKK